MSSVLCIILHGRTQALEFLAAQVREILVLITCMEALLLLCGEMSVNRSLRLDSAI